MKRGSVTLTQSGTIIRAENVETLDTLKTNRKCLVCCHIWRPLYVYGNGKTLAMEVLFRSVSNFCFILAKCCQMAMEIRRWCQDLNVTIWAASICSAQVMPLHTQFYCPIPSFFSAISIVKICTKLHQLKEKTSYTTYLESAREAGWSNSNILAISSVAEETNPSPAFASHSFQSSSRYIFPKCINAIHEIVFCCAPISLTTQTQRTPRMRLECNFMTHTWQFSEAEFKALYEVPWKTVLKSLCPLEAAILASKLTASDTETSSFFGSSFTFQSANLGRRFLSEPFRSWGWSNRNIKYLCWHAIDPRTGYK